LRVLKRGVFQTDRQNLKHSNSLKLSFNFYDYEEGVIRTLGVLNDTNNALYAVESRTDKVILKIFIC